MQDSQVHTLGWEDPLEKEMATHSNILVWEIPRTKKPGGLQSIGSQELDNDLATNQPPPHNSFSEYDNTYLKLFILVHSDRTGILFQSEIHSINFMAIQAMGPIYTAF